METIHSGESHESIRQKLLVQQIAAWWIDEDILIIQGANTSGCNHLHEGIGFLSRLSGVGFQDGLDFQCEDCMREDDYIRVRICPQAWSSPPSAFLQTLCKQLLKLLNSVYILSVTHIKAIYNLKYLFNTFQRWQHATRMLPYQFCQTRTPKPRFWTSCSQASLACLPLSNGISPSTWASMLLCSVSLGCLCSLADVSASTWGDYLRLIAVRASLYSNTLHFLTISSFNYSSSKLWWCI